ncbi:MAG TPA: hypothetical protein VL225_19730 [Vicinamibacterales bacterium]|nr:hypothetical protein [Vicinamibacterales bacterium]
MTDKERPVEINISGIPVAGVGGLGLVAIAALMTYQMPQAWLFVAAGAMGGVVVGAVLILSRHGRRPSGPSGSDPRILFRTGGPEPRSGEATSASAVRQDLETLAALGA